MEPPDDGGAAQRLTWRHAARDLAVGLKAMAMLPFVRGACSQVPRGDGQAVLLLPGFLTNDLFMRPLNQYLQGLGYDSQPWALGLNRGYGPGRDMDALLAERLHAVLRQSGQQGLTVVGWSLGGIYAKSLAKQFPQQVRQVITLGSPMAGDITELGLLPLYQWVSGVQDGGASLRQRVCALAAPVPGVPLLSIYSRNDGLVPVAHAVQPAGPLVQNVQVQASHVAMPYDPYVYCLIAHRLAQSRHGDWQPLDLQALQQSFQRGPRSCMQSM